MSGRVVKKVSYLGLAIEFETDRVPHDGRYYITRNGEVLSSASNETIAQAQLELAEEGILEAEPGHKNPRDLLKAEQGFNDILSVRGQSRAAAHLKQSARGGKGGRGGV